MRTIVIDRFPTSAEVYEDHESMDAVVIKVPRAWWESISFGKSTDYIEMENDHLEARCLNCNNAKVCKEKHWEGCVYEPTQPEIIRFEEFSTLAICAIRYCYGRMTYMPDLVRGIIRQHLKGVSDKALNVMIEDCDFQERAHLYGDERIDKPGWLRWKAELIAERERRTKE